MRRCVAVLIVLSLLTLPSAVFAQVKGRPRPPRPVGAPGAGPVEAAKVEEPEPEAEPVRKPRAPLPPKFITLKLQDGSTIAGDLSIDHIKVTTEFGELTVPIDKIKSFTPGLDSNPTVSKQLSDKLKDLESDDYQTREQAHKDLSAMGPKISKQLAEHINSENAEVKRHVTEVLKEFEQLTEEASEDDEGASQQKAWINDDTIETLNFTVIGKVSPPEFELSSKYGQLGDIVQASRPLDARESTQKSVTVSGQNLAQRSFKSTGIKVQAGDRVTITASGNITMTPWGGNAASGPDGVPQYGWYVNGSIPGGALVYRIGDKGQVQKAGARISFTAKSSGTLQLAIGIQGEYAGENYQFPGEYKTKVKVAPQ
jgi:hypothetical protein